MGREKVPTYWLGAFFNPLALLCILKQVRVVCACVCVCARVRACVCTMCVYVCVCVVCANVVRYSNYTVYKVVLLIGSKY